jgi:uncharacterized protein YegP (UPF0339 family)
LFLSSNGLVSILVAQFEIYLDTAGNGRLRLNSSGNYKTIADSTEDHEPKEDCGRVARAQT